MRNRLRFAMWMGLSFGCGVAVTMWSIAEKARVDGGPRLLSQVEASEPEPTQVRARSMERDDPPPQAERSADGTASLLDKLWARHFASGRDESDPGARPASRRAIKNGSLEVLPSFESKTSPLSASEERADPQPGTVDIADPDWRTIRGIVRYDGLPPHEHPIQIGDPICAARLHSMRHDYRIDPVGSMADVLVFVRSPALRRAAPSAVAVDVAFDGCAMQPSIAVYAPDQAIRFVNQGRAPLELESSDAIHHVVLAGQSWLVSFRTLRTLNRLQSPIHFTSATHPWAEIDGVGLAHPFWTVTQQDGRFAINGLEAGVYELEAWHPKLGLQFIKGIEISPGAHHEDVVIAYAPQLAQAAPFEAVGRGASEASEDRGSSRSR
jgi:hypothetical protein